MSLSELYVLLQEVMEWRSLVWWGSEGLHDCVDWFHCCQWLLAYVCIICHI